MKVFIGVDIGTTGIRAGVYDGDFRLLGAGNGKAEILRGERGEITREPDETMEKIEEPGTSRFLEFFRRFYHE